jgi:hypothetical protein
LQGDANPENLRYLETKRDKLGHLLEELSTERPGTAAEPGDGP